MGSHLIDGKFRSDKFPMVPAGLLPLSFKDPAAQDLIATYAKRRREGSHGSKEIDKEFSADVDEGLRLAGYAPPVDPVWETLQMAAPAASPPSAERREARGRGLRDVEEGRFVNVKRLLALHDVLEAAREATVDTHNIPVCLQLGKALRAYDEARGAVCPACDGMGTIDGPEDEPGEGRPCGACGGKKRVESKAELGGLLSTANGRLALLRAALESYAYADPSSFARCPDGGARARDALVAAGLVEGREGWPHAKPTPADSPRAATEPDVPAALLLLQQLVQAEDSVIDEPIPYPKWISTRLRAVIHALGGRAPE